MPVRRMEIAIAMLRQNNEYLLQQRDGDRKIGAAGLIGCFGGQREPKETYLQAVVRELGEETNIDLPASRYTCIGRIEVTSDREFKPVEIHAEVFSAHIPASFQVMAKEGRLMHMTLEEMRAKLEVLTPATAAVVEQVMGKSNHA